jgi:HK97 family phage prohead protease
MSDQKIYKVFSVETKAVDEEKGIYEAWLSTEVVDRDGDILLAEGAELENYLKNPVVLFGHEYRDPNAVVARALEVIKVKGKGIKLVFQFLRRGISATADLVHDLWKEKFLNAMSVGFIPKELEERTDENNERIRGYIFKLWEILEGSIVTVPANQDALRLMAKSLGYKFPDEEQNFSALIELIAAKTVVPYADHGTADEGTSWSAPTLGSFTEQSWGDLSSSQRRRIAAHYTWAASMPPENFGDLKLPHHQASTSGVGSAVWRGVAAAMGRLLQAGTQIPDSDKRGCYNHLAKHYRQFDKEPPEFRAYNEEEWKALFDVGDQDPESNSEPNNTEPPNDESDELPKGLISTLSDFITTISEVLRNE